MQIPIKKTLDKIPGGMMVVPLFLGVLVNTFFPQFLQIGGFTTALFSAKASSTILACFMFLIGSQINFKLAPKAIKRRNINSRKIYSRCWYWYICRKSFWSCWSVRFITISNPFSTNKL